MFENNKLTVKGKIIQIINDKEFSSYFSFNKHGKKLNCLNIRPINEIQEKSILNRFFFVVKKMFIFRHEYDNSFFDYPYVIEENHDYKLNDIVEINVEIKKVK